MNKIDTIFNTAKQTVLSKEEKASILHNVSSFVEANPITNNLSNVPQASPYVMINDIVRHHYYNSIKALQLQTLTTNTMIPLLILLMLTGGTSLAANNTLPGDALYPVKIHLNENVESLLAITAKADAQVNANHAILRLKEAELLANEGKLTPELNTEIKNNFANEVKSLATNLGDVKNNGDIKNLSEISDNFEKELSGRYHSLDNLVRTSTSTKSELLDLTNTVKGEHDSVQKDLNETDKLTVGSSTSPEAKTTAEGAKKSAENKIDEVQKFITANTNASTSPALATKVTEKMNEVTKEMTSANAKLVATEYADAFAEFKQATRDVQEVKQVIIFGSGKMEAGDDEEDFDSRDKEDNDKQDNNEREHKNESSTKNNSSEENKPENKNESENDHEGVSNEKRNPNTTTTATGTQVKSLNKVIQGGEVEND